MSDFNTPLSAILPSTPNASLDISQSVPTAAAEAMGDYADGDYSVSVKTRSAPDMRESTFAQTSFAMSGRI